ncbi:MAG: ABC transporter ATP-binding protein [Nitrospinota bacterium]|nr:ABC transporter ATP-binding protein [Nitrospinota bacterium]
MAEELLIDIQKKLPEGEIIFRTSAPLVHSWTVLFGPSGSGKTTLLRCIAGIERPDRGVIRFGGETWFENPGGCFIPPQKRNIGFCFQDHALFPHLSVWNNIGYNLTGFGGDEKRDRIAAMVERFRLKNLEQRQAGALSGGEKQLVALARALMRQPSLLLLDEPFAALDSPTRIALRKELRSQLSGFNGPILLVTHDRTEALTLGDRLIVLDRGKILQEGPIHEVFSKPNQKRTAEIVGMENVFPGTVVNKKDGLVHVKVADHLFTAVANERITKKVMVGIRAEDILLGKLDRMNTSARNRWHGTILSMTPEDFVVRVTLDCGFSINALITRDACMDMELALSGEVALSVKATAIHLFPLD